MILSSTVLSRAVLAAFLVSLPGGREAFARTASRVGTTGSGAGAAGVIGATLGGVATAPGLAMTLSPASLAIAPLSVPGALTPVALVSPAAPAPASGLVPAAAKAVLIGAALGAKALATPALSNGASKSAAAAAFEGGDQTRRSGDALESFTAAEERGTAPAPVAAGAPHPSAGLQKAGGSGLKKRPVAGIEQKVVSEVFKAAGVRIGAKGSHDLAVNDPAFFRRLLGDPLLQFGETYMDGLWDSPAVDEVVAKLFSAERDGRISTVLPLWRVPGLAGLALIRHGYRYIRDRLTNRQTRARSTTVAEEHYDAGNELYRLMLDPTLTYTSGVWAPGYTLEDAQNAKYDLIARKLGLKPGQRVLDIGSGFGGFARFAAKNYGAKVTGITISIEQLKAARALSAGVEGVEFLYSDYRDIPHRFPKDAFDHVVSIEMIEAVGPKNLAEYFQAAHAALKDGGRFVIQAIANNRDVFNNNPWAGKYIFRDGVAPSTEQVDKAARRAFGRPVDRQRITGHYDKTLMAWHENFTRAWPQLKGEYGERFKRMWDFYLLAAAGLFRAGDIQLDQTVYVKGGRPGEEPRVRELPTRRRLDAMRASPEEKDRTARQISRLEEEKRAVAAALEPRAARAAVTLPRDARVAVIGAGPSGLSSALELRRLGYTNVVVFESGPEAGGKSHTVNIDGKPHDLGATMGVKGKYAQIERLAKRHGQAAVRFPKEVQYDLESGGPAKKASLLDSMRLLYEGARYLLHRALMAAVGGRGLEVPPDELADPWPVVMNRRGLGLFKDKMTTYLTGYGYGGPQTPAVFAERMLDLSAVTLGAAGPAIMWENGTQPIWKGVASGLNVRVNAEIERVERSGDGARVYLKGGKTPERFDRLIVAVDPRTALRVLDATAEERALFSMVRYMPYATFAVRVEGFAQGRAEVGYLKENMTPDRVGRPMAWIKRHADDDVFVFHLHAPPSISDEQITANIAGDMRRLGAGKVTLVDSRRWPFFPHVDSAAIREERFYERARSLQGLNRTVFVNEALAMSTMPDAARQGTTAARRLASGEY